MKDKADLIIENLIECQLLENLAQEEITLTQKGIETRLILNKVFETDKICPKCGEGMIKKFDIGYDKKTMSWFECVECGECTKN